MIDVKAHRASVVSSSRKSDILQVEKRIRGRVKRQMEKTQRRYYPERADQGDPEGTR